MVNKSDIFRDERARIELAVDVTAQVMEKYLLLSVDADTSLSESFSKSCDEVLYLVSFFFRRAVP